MPSRDFRNRVKQATQNKTLRSALDRAAEAYWKSRCHAFQDIDFCSLREELRAHKDASLESIHELFDRFRSEAKQVGVSVYQAADSAEANRIVLDIAQVRGVRKITKSKSMLTEEIELNHHLEAAGMEVTETDLGEWILQLAGERPSHFTTPAIHETREQIAELFSKVTGETIEPEIPKLVEVARKSIRQAFLNADLGISGANIAIAETGTLVIVSNEGNARLVTSLPDYHVALVGYEKLVPSLDAATSILKLLARSGTGQKMTTYVSFITGPSRTSDIEKTLTLGCHGPRELHIVFVDNGRLKLIDDPEFREALCCIKCGACLGVCPVYRTIGGHVFGHTYVGGIGAILAAFHTGLAEAEDIVNVCSTCGRCKSYCPARIDVPRMILGLRERLVEAKGQPWAQRLLFNVLGSPKAFDHLLDLARTTQPVWRPISRLPLPWLSGLSRIPPLAERSFTEQTPPITEPIGASRGAVTFYPGCVIDNVYPEIGTAVVRVLSQCGYEVRAAKESGCCGMPAVVKGDSGTAAKLASHNSKVLRSQGSDVLLTACPTCLSGLEKQSVDVESPMHVRDFAEFLYNSIQPDSDVFSHVGDPVKVTYHDPCHAVHHHGLGREPRELLRMAGYEVVEMKDSDTCCGFAGSYSVTYPEVSDAVLQRKLENIRAASASIVVTDCPGCLMQLRQGLEKSGIDIQAMHTAEALEKRLR